MLQPKPLSISIAWAALASLWGPPGCRCNEPVDAVPGKVAVLEDGAEVKVLRVVKGDELVVAYRGRRARLRMCGIHAFAPVVDDPRVVEASQKVLSVVREAVLDQHVRVKLAVPSTDPFGRYLAYVHRNDVDLNRQLVAEGWAVVYTEYPFDRLDDYLAAEQAARAVKKNLWADPLLVKTVLGLRKQWHEVRAKRNERPLNDSLLE